VRSSIGIRMAADPTVVFELARDVERWAELLPHYRQSRIEARSGDRVLARMIALRPVGPLAIPVTWRAVCWSETDDAGDLRLRFRHVRGATRGMDVTWHIRPAGSAGGSDVRIEHDFRRSIPLLGRFVGPDVLPALIDRYFTRPVASRTLATFRSLAEAHGVVMDRPVHGQSRAAVQANTRP
jgi:aromatase